MKKSDELEEEKTEKVRKYTILRIRDPRLDPDTEGPLGPPVIFRFRGTPELAKVYGERKRLDVWILDEELEWSRKDRQYWKDLFKRANNETFMPGLCVYEPRWNGESQQDVDEVFQYWKRLCYKGDLPIGEADIWDPEISGFPPNNPLAYRGPRDTSQWIRVLRYWIRREALILEGGARRTLNDYPPEVKQGLSIAIELMTKDLDCVDNIRYAETRKPGEMRRFRKAAQSGCCGSEKRFVIIGTTQYVIGCNYGH